MPAKLMVIGSFVMAWMSLMPRAAAAQARPARDPGFVSAGTDRLLVLSASAAGGYDVNVAASGDSIFGGGGPRPGNASSFADLAGELRYVFKEPRFDLAASAATNLRRYPEVLEGFITNHRASVDGAVRLGRRTQVHAHQSAALQPYYLLGPADTALEAAASPEALYATDTVLSRRRGVVATTNIDLTRTISRRTSLAGLYGYRSTNYTGEVLDVRSQTVGGRLTRGLTRNAGLRAGYRYEDGFYGSREARSVQIHYLDTGVDYNRALSSSKRTTIALSTGAAIIRDRDDRMVRLTGHGGIARRIGRTWNADVLYQHDVGFVHTFPAPTESDRITARAGGFLNRRFQFAVTAGYTNGVVGLTDRGNGFDVSEGTAVLSTALNRNMAISVAYFYYHYSFASSVVLPAGWPREMDRPGIRVQVTTWLPLFQHLRRPNAGR